MYNCKLTQENIKNYLEEFNKECKDDNSTQFAAFLIMKMQATDKYIQDKENHEEAIKDWGRNMAAQLKEKLNVHHTHTGYHTWSYEDDECEYIIYYVPNKENDFKVSVRNKNWRWISEISHQQFKTIEEIIEFRNKFELAQ